MSDASWRGRFVPIAILLTAASCASAQQATDVPAAAGNFAGVWSWGSPRRSAEVPFLRISRNGPQWIVETKHYMRDHFVSTVKEVRVSGNHLEFSYWYAPLDRWAKCTLNLSDDKLAGVCEGEPDARQSWGAVPTSLWRFSASP